MVTRASHPQSMEAPHDAPNCTETGDDYYGTGFHLHFVTRPECKLFGLEEWQAAAAVFGGAALILGFCFCCCVCCYCKKRKKKKRGSAASLGTDADRPRRSVRTGASSTSLASTRGMTLQGGFPVGAKSTLVANRTFMGRRSDRSAVAAGGQAVATVKRTKRKNKTKDLQRENGVAPKLQDGTQATTKSSSHSAGSSCANDGAAYDFVDELSHLDKFGLDSQLPPIEIPRGDLDFAVSGVSELGRGQFGAVKRAWWRLKKGQLKRKNVAVKELTGSPGADAVKEFMFEGALAAQFNHENVSALHGVVTIGLPTYLVFSYCSKGSLENCLNGTGRKSLNDTSDAALVTIIKGVAAGMAYLANLAFVHRDLASRNILMNARDIPKVADFGMARTTTDNVYESINTKMMPLRWSAPEAFSSMVFSEKSDVWAFGVTVIEVFTRAETPYIQWSDADVARQVSDGYKIRRPEGCPSDIYKEIVNPCLSYAPEDRPRFSELFAGTRAIIRKPSYVGWKPGPAEDDDALYEVVAEMVSGAPSSGALHAGEAYVAAADQQSGQQGSSAPVYSVPLAQRGDEVPVYTVVPDLTPSSDFAYVDMSGSATAETDQNAGADDTFAGFGDDLATGMATVGMEQLSQTSVSDLEVVDGLAAGL